MDDCVFPICMYVYTSVPSAACIHLVVLDKWDNIQTTMLNCRWPYNTIHIYLVVWSMASMHHEYCKIMMNTVLLNIVWVVYMQLDNLYHNSKATYIMCLLSLR